MTPYDLIENLIRISRSYLDESEQTLRNRYIRKLGRREIFCILGEGKIDAFVEWCWIKSEDDVERAMSGCDTSGDILYVNGLYIAPGHSDLIFKLRHYLPNHTKLIFNQLHKGNRLRIHSKP